MSLATYRNPMQLNLSSDNNIFGTDSKVSVSMPTIRMLDEVVFVQHIIPASDTAQIAIRNKKKKICPFAIAT